MGYLGLSFVQLLPQTILSSNGLICTDLTQFVHLPDLGAGKRGESFPSEEVSLKVLGRANGSKAQALQPSSQQIAVLLGDPSDSRNCASQKFRHLESRSLLSGVHFEDLEEDCHSYTI